MPYIKNASIPIILSLFALLIFSSSVSAVKLTSSESVVIGETEIIEDDVYIFGGQLTVLGTIKGDLIASGGTINVNGNVEGDLIAAGGIVVVSGDISDDTRIAGGQLTFNGNAGDNLVMAGGMINVGEDATVNGDLLVSGGQVTIAGIVEGNASITSSTINLLPGSSIKGNLEYSGPVEANLEGRNNVVGEVTFVKSYVNTQETTSRIIAGLSWAFMVLAVIMFLGYLALGYILIKLFPSKVSSIMNLAKKTVLTISWLVWFRLYWFQWLFLPCL